MKSTFITTALLASILITSCSNITSVDFEKEKAAIIKVIEGETNNYFNQNYDEFIKTHLQNESSVRIGAWKNNYQYIEGWDSINARIKPDFDTKYEATNLKNINSNYKFKIFPNSALVTYNSILEYDYKGEHHKDEYPDIQTRFLEKTEEGWKISYLSYVNIYGYETEKKNRIPFSTKNEEALKLYEKAISYAEEVKHAKAIETYKQAIEKEPEFFMPMFQLATMNYYFKKFDEFNKYLNKINQLDSLNIDEELMRIQLNFIKDKKFEKASELNYKLYLSYPYEPQVFFNAYFFLSLADKTDASINWCNFAIRRLDKDHIFHNILGYLHLKKEDYEAAEKAFDKYIELKPDWPNTYDSKGDYYLAKKDYKNAYEMFMKAYSMDSTFTVSLKKAEEAKAETEK